LREASNVNTAELENAEREQRDSWPVPEPQWPR
jgi:hypothetical protein